MRQKILIVDDDARNIFALSSVLTVKGYPCLSATSAIQGLQYIEETDAVGIALIDMMMPEMDGYEMLNRIRQGTKSKLPLIAVTAQAMTGDKEKCLQAGADEYISKPIDIDLLIAILDKHYVRSDITTN